MFDNLTVSELDALTTKLCNAIHEWRRRAFLPWTPELLTELRTTEHDAWHVRCVKSGIRCLQDT